MHCYRRVKTTERFYQFWLLRCLEFPCNYYFHLCVLFPFLSPFFQFPISFSTCIYFLITFLWSLTPNFLSLPYSLPWNTQILLHSFRIFIFHALLFPNFHPSSLCVVFPFLILYSTFLQFLFLPSSLPATSDAFNVFILIPFSALTSSVVLLQIRKSFPV